MFFHDNSSKSNKWTQVCVLINLVHAAYPHWIKVNCYSPQFHTVVCQNHRVGQQERGKWKPLASAVCHKNSLLFMYSCVKVLLRTENVMNKYTKEIKSYIQKIFHNDKHFLKTGEIDLQNLTIIHQPATNLTSRIDSMLNLFKCNSTVFISSVSVSDGEVDCGFGNVDDEFYCSTGCLNMTTNSCSHQQSATTCKENFFLSRSGQCRSYYNVTALKENQKHTREFHANKNQMQEDSVMFSCSDDGDEFYFFYQSCLFGTSENETLLFCSNGIHLQNCEFFQCVGQFKCPKSYCIGFSSVCDNKWDCLHGIDETNCETFNCSTLFKCKNSRKCIHLLDVCDGVYHCALKDDEIMCDLIKCHTEGCACLNYAITCHQAQGIKTYFERYKVLPFVYVFMTNSINKFPSIYFAKFKGSVSLELPHNQIKTICCSEHFGPRWPVVSLNVGHNDISMLSKNCLGSANILGILILHENTISVLQSFAFAGLESLQILDLSLNFLSSLEPSAFQDLTQIRLVNLFQEQQFDFVHKTAFTNDVQLVVVKDYHVCCVSRGPCTARKCFPDFCHNFFFNNLFVALTWYISIGILLSNIFDCLSTTTFARKDDFQKHRKSGYLYITVSLNTNGFFLSSIFLAMLLTDQIFGTHYIGSSLARNGKIFCSLVGPLMLFWFLVSVSVICWLFLCRYKIIANPIETQFKHAGYVKKLLCGTYLLLISVVVVILLLYENVVGFHLLAMPLCSIMSQANSNNVSFVITVALTLFLLLSSVSVVMISILALCSLFHASPDLGANNRMIMNKKKTKRQATLRIICLVFSCVPCYVTSVCLLSMLLLQEKSGIQLLLWFNLFLMPHPLLMNPIALNVGYFSAHKFRSSHP